MSSSSSLDNNITKLASWCNVANPYNVVYNNECVYTFYGPYHTDVGGLLVNLSNFVGTCETLAHCTLQTNEQEGLFVRILKTRTLKDKAADGDDKTEIEEKTSLTEGPPTKLGVGVEGGFTSADDKYDVTSTYSLVLLSKQLDGTYTIVEEKPYNEETKNKNFPTMISMSIDSIINHTGSAIQQDLKSWQLNDEPLKESKYASNLPFVDNGIKISPNPSTWKCQKDGSSENIWLNLSTGYMGGGRKNWDGSGGSNGALDHYNDTGKLYPLVVKLGTITSDPTTADCYSYAPDEDGPVKISNLNELLAKRGIHVASLQKTVKSTAELEVELNATYEFDAITESGYELIPVSGKGLQGLQNLGNTCYVNTVVQTLFSGTIPELSKRYGCYTTKERKDDSSTSSDIVTSPTLFQSITGTDAPDHVLVQTTKLAMALTSGIYADPNTSKKDLNADKDLLHPKYRIAPRMHKHSIAKNHVEFSTGQQQDAAHFIQYLFDILDENELKYSTSHMSSSSSLESETSSPFVVRSSHLFSFYTTSRIVCTADGLVKYQTPSIPETILSLRIPMELATKTSSSKEEESKETTTVTTPDAKRAKSSDDEEGTIGNAGNNNNNENKKMDDDDDVVVQRKDDTKKNDDENDEDVPSISLDVCFESWHTPTTIEDYRWEHLSNTIVPATSQCGIQNFPKYLLIQLNRYEQGLDWLPKKLNVKVNVPSELNLNHYKCTGKQQDGESLVPNMEDAMKVDVVDTTPAEAAVQPVPIDEMSLTQLMDMGFSLYGCQRALKAVGGSNVELAMNWIFEHNTDPDFNDPLPPDGGAGGGDDEESTNAAVASTTTGTNSVGSNAAVPSGTASSGGITVDETLVTQLVDSLGCFTSDQVRAALKTTNNSPDRAADWLFSHMDDLDTAIAALEVTSGGGGSGDGKMSASAGGGGTSASAATTTTKIPLDDSTDGTYVIKGCISHIGKHTGSGHYVCHLLKSIQGKEKWIIYNDEKVAISEHPPLEHAYLYLYQRKDTINQPPDERF